MKSENQMRNLGLLNVLWDGTTVQVDRRTSESFVIHNVRLTVALQVQEAAFRAFHDDSDGQARGMGFLARFLMTWPISTQGTRAFRDLPQFRPALAAFNERIAALLATRLEMAPEGGVRPVMLTLSPEAKSAWVAFHDGVERQLVPGGYLADVRDVAAKIADNAARVAALFHTFEVGPHGQISASHMANAIRVASYHLAEARRFFAEIALPKAASDVIRVDTYLLDVCRALGTDQLVQRELQNAGPVRERGRLDAALAELTALTRVRLQDQGRRKLVIVNPALLL